MVDINKQLQMKIKEFVPKADVAMVGEVVNAGDGVAFISGLGNVASQELLDFPGGVRGIALNLEDNGVGSIILGDFSAISEGDIVRATGKLLQVPVGRELLGRVINPLAEPLDGGGKIKTKQTSAVEKIAPGVTARQPVDTPVQTGIKAIDSMIPIGRGQRELIIGDRGTGKTAITLDTILNQKNQNLICIYVAIGQKESKVAQFIETLRVKRALDYTIVVAANASDPAALQYLAPYAATSMGEYFRDQGQDVLLVYDDLTKHAWAYRQISLVLKRPSGREAYPGDIFYLHSRLLERSCRLNKENGGGSLTALPIIETQAGDLSAYIPTNVISITDGQIYLESDLFYAGIRPAVNVGLSVSRVGGTAQTKAMKQVAGSLRLDLAQYRELAAFVQFASDLDAATRARIERGARMVELLKQPQFVPMPVEEQIVVFWMATAGYLNDVPLEKIQQFEREYLKFLNQGYKKILEEIKKQKKLSDEIVGRLKKATEEFKEQ